MPVIELSDATVEVDDEGFLVDFEDWDENVACELARREGVEYLAKDRMDILEFMRDYYRKFNSFPILNAVCKNVHQPKECTYEQFPDPIIAWKIAGLPKPTTEVFQAIRHKIG
jgi:tRNA 2-thiouridine synthesizing protein E